MALDTLIMSRFFGHFSAFFLRSSGPSPGSIFGKIFPTSPSSNARNSSWILPILRVCTPPRVLFLSVFTARAMTLFSSSHSNRTSFIVYQYNLYLFLSNNSVFYFIFLISRELEHNLRMPYENIYIQKVAEHDHIYSDEELMRAKKGKWKEFF